jgi:hypothetical protein
MQKICVVVGIWLTWNDNNLLQVGLSVGWDINIHNIAIISTTLLLFMSCISLHNLFSNVWYVIKLL